MTRRGSRGTGAVVVLGTRPEVVKLAGVIRGLGSDAQVVHTGQHYDDALSGEIFCGLGLPEPRVGLRRTGGLPRVEQVSSMIDQLGRTFEAARPAVVVVQGDTNSASAGAQAAHYLGIDVLHVEAGLRSHDRTMPEEINRRIIGVLADVHCAPTEGAAAHLLAEGVEPHRIHLTGNTAVEAVRASLPGPEARRAVLKAHGLCSDGFVLATVHRPENTDDPERLRLILGELVGLGLPVLLPIHPRTRARARRYGLDGLLAALRVVEPVDHATFLALAHEARLLVSDSGGVQEECTVLKRPLVVVRNNTERPEAMDSGFAVLAAPGPDIGFRARALLDDPGLAARLAATPSPFGDGRAGDRIVGLIRTLVERAVPSTRRVSDRPAVAAPGVRPASLPSPVGAPTGPHPPGGNPCTDHPMPAEPRPEAFSPPPEAATTSTSSC
ncbi:non-hydrolyzing UDP-N-acetylglucosamine 2-epimerase [Streptomyces sp. CB02613]|uniref:non-hydrolyzing UDP-N-acetylglucosamine 2-epimerase n=1 Tax=Streptomyces sp. CB02613 TaxID=2020328 RepID=UPI0018FEB3C7|nr:UDP-N-acetylglucosamine 2-epimerase (non-hydrolyzing) [Streptomyces sp. CB02613]